MREGSTRSGRRRDVAGEGGVLVDAARCGHGVGLALGDGAQACVEGYRPQAVLGAVLVDEVQEMGDGRRLTAGGSQRYRNGNNGSKGSDVRQAKGAAPDVPALQ